MAKAEPSSSLLSAPSLLQCVRKEFSRIPEHRGGGEVYTIPDTLMSALAMFGLKYSSLLRFDEQKNEPAVRYNLETLYGVGLAPSDTQMRSIVDGVSPVHLESAFTALHRVAERQNVFKEYEYLGGYHLVPLDGTGHFCSGKVSCPHCCAKTQGNGVAQYYHQLLGAVVVHPDRPEVIPLAPEAITKGDGQTKNDCERNAAKRLLKRVKEQYQHLRPIIVEDSLSSNGPHIKLLKELGFRCILGVKPGDHEALFKDFDEAMRQGGTEEFETADKAGVIHGYRFVNGLGLNASHPDIKVNFLEYWEHDGDRETVFTWVTDFHLHQGNVEAVMRGGRARWKIENETFNTLKNQGYHLEHNYGHGEKYLATDFGYLTMLAFLVDQLQALGCELFRQAVRARRTKASFWEKLRTLFLGYLIPSWEILWQAIGKGHMASMLVLDTT
jgi:hypothetical protein